MQKVLGIPQLLCKMPLKTNPDVHYHGADGIYGNYDNNIKKFCLYWGESKLYKDIGQAMTDCFYRERDLTLLRDNLDFDNEELEKAIVSFFDPDDEDYLSLEYRGACLVGYDEEAYPSDFSVVESQIKEAIQNKICEFLDLFNVEVDNMFNDWTEKELQEYYNSAIGADLKTPIAQPKSSIKEQDEEVEIIEPIKEVNPVSEPIEDEEEVVLSEPASDDDLENLMKDIATNKSEEPQKEETLEEFEFDSEEDEFFEE